MFDLKKYKSQMKKPVKAYQKNLDRVRIGRANPKILDGITFPYYGVDTPINQAATISVPEARLLVIQPWDKKNLQPIEKAILASNIGITPNNDGQVIRLPFPELTEERRQEEIKNVSKMAEDTKVSIRNIRREAMDEVKKAEKASDLTEDERYRAEDDIQDLTDETIDQVEKIFEDKKAELLEI